MENSNVTAPIADSPDPVDAAAHPRASAQTKARPWLAPLVIYLLCSGIYVGTAGERILRPSDNNHFVHLAQSFLSGQLHVVGNRPPGTNDWACFDETSRSICGDSAVRTPRPGEFWYVSFPPLPALVLAPAVAIFGLGTSDTLCFALLAGLGPMGLFLLFRFLRREGVLTRTDYELWFLTALYAVGSVFYFVSVQGTVWFSAHVVASAILPWYLRFAFKGRSPFLAGLCLILLFFTRPTTLFFGAYFVLEVLNLKRSQASNPMPDQLAPDQSALKGLMGWVRATQWKGALRPLVLFAIPVLIGGVLAMWMNHARFQNPFEFGHRYLMIGWQGRIERWGLFNYHYLSKNLAVFTSSLPWWNEDAPHIRISRHGLAIWVTTPLLLWALFPKKWTQAQQTLLVAMVLVMFQNLLYQNSGWVQFGYRFACDYLTAWMLLLAMSGRSFGVGAHLLLLWSMIINLFGAVTFDRHHEYYDDDGSQTRVFQPD